MPLIPCYAGYPKYEYTSCRISTFDTFTDGAVESPDVKQFLLLMDICTIHKVNPPREPPHIFCFNTLFCLREHCCW